MANADTLRLFVDVINNPANPHFQDQDFLVDTYFCADNPAVNPLIPCAGITDHGPTFKGRADVKSLFQRLFATFRPMAWVPVPGAPQLTGASNIGIQMTVTGLFQGGWFPIGSGHESAPLTQLAAATGKGLGRSRRDASGLPAFAVFTFNAGTLIQQLQIYTDRY
ncbi:MAG TPA: hypothetical protein VGL41_00160, partial [Roseiarcus sp.]